MRILSISEGEYYHLYNRGTSKQQIFFDLEDHVRFLFALLYFQSLKTFERPGYFTSTYIQHGFFDHEVAEEVAEGRCVELVAFSMMPNHFHALVYEKQAGGIARYMQRMLNAYTKYFNTKYERSGHLFQGPYRAVHICDNEQILHLSAYIHRNPIELRTAGHRVFRSEKYETYPWSSCQDYIDTNRWGGLLVQNTILEQFSDPKEYRAFLSSSTAKDSWS